MSTDQPQRARNRTVGCKMSEGEYEKLAAVAEQDGHQRQVPPDASRPANVMAKDQSCTYVVLDPDPEYFWHDRLGGYPVFEFSRGDSSDEYLKFLNKPFGNNPGGNMADMWYSYVIFPLSLKWFVHTIRSDRDDTGYLWILPEWADGIVKTYPFVRGELSRVQIFDIGHIGIGRLARPIERLAAGSRWLTGGAAGRAGGDGGGRNRKR